MRGSPFAAGGVGTGQGLASQGSLQLSSDGRCLLTVDAGRNQISVPRIKPGGALKRVGRSPVSSDGTTLRVVHPTAGVVSGFAVNRGRLHRTADLAHARFDRGRTRR